MNSRLQIYMSLYLIIGFLIHTRKVYRPKRHQHKSRINLIRCLPATSGMTSSPCTKLKLYPNQDKIQLSMMWTIHHYELSGALVE